MSDEWMNAYLHCPLSAPWRIPPLLIFPSSPWFRGFHHGRSSFLVRLHPGHHPSRPASASHPQTFVQGDRGK